MIMSCASPDVQMAEFFFEGSGLNWFMLKVSVGVFQAVMSKMQF